MSKDNASDVTDIPSGNDLDQLRSILFGNQVRAIEKRLNDLEMYLETVRREINQHFDDRLDGLAETTSANLDKTEKEFNDRLTKLEADFRKQLQNTQKELSQQIEKQSVDFQRKLLDFQTEARQRDDDLRIELLALGAMLDNQKAGRAELAQMLLQMSEELQGNVKKTAVSSTATSKTKTKS